MISDFINISIVCEGPTEVDFIKKKLNKEYFNPINISLKPIAINKTAHQQSLEGNISVDRLVTFVKKAEFKIVTTLVDFYGFKKTDKKTPHEIEEELEARVNQEFFIPYLQVHETEALWFSDKNAIAGAKNANDQQQRMLSDIIQQYPNPEDINDSRETAPSKRLEKIFTDYKKIIDGNHIFDKISVETMKSKCPRFAKWLDIIEVKAEILRRGK